MFCTCVLSSQAPGALILPAEIPWNLPLGENLTGASHHVHGLCSKQRKKCVGVSQCFADGIWGDPGFPVDGNSIMLKALDPKRLDSNPGSSTYCLCNLGNYLLPLCFSFFIYNMYFLHIIDLSIRWTNTTKTYNIVLCTQCAFNY